MLIFFVGNSIHTMKVAIYIIEFIHLIISYISFMFPAIVVINYLFIYINPLDYKL